MSKAARQERVVGWMARGVIVAGGREEVGLGGGGRRAVRKAVRSGLGSGSCVVVVVVEGGMVISGFEEGGGWGVSRWVESGCGGGVGGSMFGEAQSQPIDAVGEVESDTEMSALSTKRVSLLSQYGRDDISS